jgi:tetratricopeptide (TPR) repeat protein
MKRTIILSLLILLFTNCFADDAAMKNLWQKANAFYNQKAYDSAAYCFEQIASQHPAEAEVYYNLGNTYYKLNRIGPAVLNYERALFYKPSYKEAQDNLYLTQGRISNRIPAVKDIFFIRWWKGITAPANANTWAVVSLLLFLAIIALLLTKRLNKHSLPSQIAIALASIWIITLIVAIASSNKRHDSSKGVVMQEGAEFALQPGGKSQSLIPEGTTVKWEEERTEWVEVELPDGRTGWIRKSALTKI